MINFHTTVAIKYSQNNQEYLSLVLPFEVIEKISKVLIYGKDKYGYQRKLNERHSRDIAKNIIKNNVSLPTSIILSVDSEYIKKLLVSTGEDASLVKITLNTEEKEFRIVDGQHRIRGLGEAAIKDEIYKKFQLNVIIMITEKNKRVIEVETFRNINSLGKKIKTDLTLLAEYNYQLLQKKDIDKIDEHIAVKTAYYLNEKIINSVWCQAIQFNVNDDNISGIIGVSAFQKSISPLIRIYLNDNPDNQEKSSERIIAYTDHVAEEIAMFINNAWNGVLEKWDYCFKKKNIEESYEYVNTYYNEGYYLQKTTGTHALHSILTDCVEKEGVNGNALESFIKIIKESQITSDQWKIGGMFSGLTSGSGFRKAKQYVLNIENDKSTNKS